MQNQAFPPNVQQPFQYQPSPFRSREQNGSSSDFTEEQMRHYFYKTADIYKWLILWGCVLFLLGIFSFNSLRTIGLVCIFLVVHPPN